jgi:pyruvate kinase
MTTEDPVIGKIKQDRGFGTWLAAKLKISRSAVHQWTKVPPKRVWHVAKLLDMQPHTIRPDIFPPPRRPKGSVKHR